MKNKKISAASLIVAALLILSTLSLTGCGEVPPSKTKADSKPTIGVLIYKKDDTYISLVGESLQKAFAEKATVLLQHGQNEQLTQNEQLDAMIEKKVDALVVNLVETQAAADVVDKAKKAGIPVVFFNREPDLNVIKSYNKASFVGTNALDAGKMQGDIIKKIWASHPEYDRSKNGKLQYVMFQGNLDNPEAVARTEYSVKQARALGVPMQQIGETYVCNWEESLAKQAMQAALAAHQDQIELVIANNDSMALGAIAALAERGYNTGDTTKFIPVVGVDATPQAMAAIQKGAMSATVKQDGEGMGAAIAALTLNAIAGKGFLDGTPYAWDASGVAIRIPYSMYSGEK